MQRKGYHVYVDGSFLDEVVGYGAVILKDGSMHDEISGYVDVPGAAEYRNIAGELQAVRETVRWCGENGVGSVHIYYDYNGIAAWATGRWKAKKELTRAYAAFMSKAELDITWHKVAGHSGDAWNDHADKLAKQGARAGQGTAVPDRKTLDADAELLARGQEFCTYLATQGVTAACDGVFNRMFVRILIKRDTDRVGIFDLYNTKKKPWSPYLHTFKADSLKRKLQEHWDSFCG